MSDEIGERYDDVIAFCQQIDKYIEDNPELKEYACGFRERVWERHHRIRKRLASACRICGIDTPEHPLYRSVEKQIVGIHYAWDRIKEDVLNGSKTIFPD